MNIPENLPYRGQIIEAVKNNNLRKCVRQLQQILSNNERIIRKSLETELPLKSIEWNGGNLQVIEIESINGKLDALTRDAINAKNRLGIVMHWAEKEGVI